MSDKPDKPNKPDTGASATSAAPSLASEGHCTARLETTLFDLAKASLKVRGVESRATKDQIYHELNSIMVFNAYEKANIDNKVGISDKDLPRGWNNVRLHQEFKLCQIAETQASDKDLELRRKLAEQIKAETSTVPVQEGEGYFQVLKRMHPEQKDEDLSSEAHRIKGINGNRRVLIVGERLPTVSEEERGRELERRYKQIKQAPAKPEPPAAQLPKPKPDPKPESPKPEPEHKPESPKPEPEHKPAPPVAELPKPKPDPKPESPKPESVDLEKVYRELASKHHFAAAELSSSEKGQGIIGRTFDSAKNNIGTSGEGHAWYDPRRMWSGLFDRDLGSNAINQRMHEEALKLESLKKAAQSKDLGRFSIIYKDLTGKEFDPKQQQVVTVRGAKLSDNFEESQHSGVDAITDIGTAVAVAATVRAGKLGTAETLLRSMGVGAAVGSVTKSGLMQVDGRYANLRHDVIAGSLTGAIVPLGELGGAQMSRFIAGRNGLTVTGDLLTGKIETQGAALGTRLLSAAAKSGTSGAIYGGLESPARVALTDVEKGREIKLSDLAIASLRGTVTGFITGSVLGATVDGISDGFKSLRPGSLKSVKSEIGGVQAPASGAVSLDDAAKILKTDPGTLAKSAVDKPYSVVAEAVKLYENTGLNIRKVDPLTGDSLLPKPFAEALDMVQNVDLLTAESKVKLGSKVKVVEATDSFIKANPKAVEEPLARIEAEPSYQEVVRLKTAQGGAPAAAEFEQTFRQGMEKDLKTSMAVEQIRNKGATPENTLKSSQAEVEASYKQKAADYFKDMTDPAQRLRLNELVDDIYDKFSPENISKSDIEKILGDVPPKDRELAVALLHNSAGNSSDVILKARMQALKSDIASQTGSSSPDHVFTLAPDSSANLLGYLYRKSNSISMDMRNIDYLAEQVKNGNTPQSVVLFDDLSSTSIRPADLQMLKKIPKVFVVDVGAFEKSVNIIDVSKGPQAVAEKLNSLLASAREIRSANPGMLDAGVAGETLRAGVDKAASAIGPNVQIIRPSGSLQIPNAVAPSDLIKMGDVDALHAQYNVPKASKEQIAGFLSGYVGEERELAARMLAEGAVHNSFPVMVKKAIDLHRKVAEALSASGLKMNDLLVVSDKDPGGSTHLISYLFGKANGLSSENFVSTQRLNQMIATGNVKERAIAYFDDTIYSGSQTTGMLNGNVSSLMPFKKVVIASLGAYEKGLQNIRGTHLSSIGKVEVATSSMHQPFYSEGNPFYSGLAAAQRSTVKSIGGSEGFGSVQGSLIWSYMYPDNNLNFFGPKFSGGVLRLPGP